MGVSQKKEVAKHIFEREPGRTPNSVAEEVGIAPQTARKVQDEVGSAYLKNSNKDSSEDDAPFIDTARDEEAIERKEVSGRRTRGRKPLSPEEKARRAKARAEAKAEAKKET